MSRFREFPKAGNVLDLSRNYYLRKNGTFKEFPVKVIYLPAPPAPQFSSPCSTTSVPAEFTPSAHPKSTKAQHSSPPTTPLFSSEQQTSSMPNVPASSPLSTKLDRQTKIPKTASKKANSSGGKAKKQKLDPDVAFATILCDFYGDEKYKRMIMERAKVVAMERAAAATAAAASASAVNNKKKRGRPRKLNNSNPQGKAADHQEKEYKKKGRPQKITKKLEQSSETELSKLQAEAATPEVNKNKKRGRPRKIVQEPEQSLEPEFRNLKDLQTRYEQKEKGKGGCKKQGSTNVEKRRICDKQQLIKKHCEQQQSSEKGTNMQEDDDFQREEPEMPEEIQQQGARTPEELQHEEPIARTAEEPIGMAKEVQEEEPIAKAGEEQSRKTENNNVAMLGALTNIMLQLTKITNDIAQLIVMASGKSQND